jgi:hypothetical protein
LAAATTSTAEAERTPSPILGSSDSINMVVIKGKGSSYNSLVGHNDMYILNHPWQG